MPGSLRPPCQGEGEAAVQQQWWAGLAASRKNQEGDGMCMPGGRLYNVWAGGECDHYPLLLSVLPLYSFVATLPLPPPLRQFLYNFFA